MNPKPLAVMKFMLKSALANSFIAMMNSWPCIDTLHSFSTKLAEDEQFFGEEMSVSGTVRVWYSIVLEREKQSRSKAEH